MPSAAFIHSAEIERYHYPGGSPFKTERAAMTRGILGHLGLLTGDGRREVAPSPARARDLYRFHTPDFIHALKRVSKGQLAPADLFLGLGTADCPVFPDLYHYAVLAAGGTLTAARLILEGEVDHAFNPSGGYHHARAEEAGGFCYINDVVLAAKVLRDAGRRVFCLDLDAHHGNGTQEAFWRDPRVFTVSLHESGETLFPWGGFESEIGAGEGNGYNVNVPLPPGTDDELYRWAFERVVPPLMAMFKADVFVLELGMDVLSVDPLSHLSMTNNALADIIPVLLGFGKPVLAVGGGGYEPHATARGWALCWSVLCGAEPEFSPAFGLGGVFLGSEEWGAGLRDRHIYADGATQRPLIEKTVEAIQRTVFPLHGL